MTEPELVRECRGGNEEAFVAIYQRHRLPVFQFAWRLTGSQSEAEDLAQECFLAVVSGAAFVTGLFVWDCTEPGVASSANQRKGSRGGCGRFRSH